MNTPMKKQQFIIDRIIYPRLHILSGDPKIGKSWMTMDMCLSVAKGENFLGRKTEQGHEIRSLGIDYEKTKSNGVRNIYITYSGDRDSSGGKILCTENVDPAVPEKPANAYDSLNEVECGKLSTEKNAVPANPIKVADGNAFIAMAAEMKRNNLSRQGIFVLAFNSEP